MDEMRDQLANIRQAVGQFGIRTAGLVAPATGLNNRCAAEAPSPPLLERVAALENRMTSLESTFARFADETYSRLGRLEVLLGA